MKPDLDQAAAVISKRLDLDALYLGGPFDARGEPASPDVHILAISRDHLIRDLHLVPGTSRFERRVEVSVVPLSILRQAVDRGVSTWFTFYTADKIRTGRPLLESPEASGLRRRALAGLKIRPAFYADALRGVLQAAGHMIGPSDRASDGKAAAAVGVTKSVCTARVAAESGRLLALLAVHAAVRGRRTFSRLSEMLSRGAPFPVSLPDADRPDAARALAAAARTLAGLFMFCGIDQARLAPAPGPTAAPRPTTEGQQGATA